MISLKQIHYALAVEETLHFRKAAERCSISPSALSTALADMEKSLGFQVFERDNKKVLVTPLGREVLEKARVIKREMSDLQRLEETHGRPLSSTMSIGIIPTIAPYLLPIILPSLHAKYPKLDLEVAETQSHVLVEQVRNGDLDAGILALPYDCEGLLTFPFWEENFFWITHRDEAPAETDQIWAAQIDPSRLMLLEEGHCLKDHALAVCQLPQAYAHKLGATSLPTLVQLVAGKLGSTIVPAMALPALVDMNPELVRLPLAEAGPHREIAFVVRPTYPGLRNIETLRTLFVTLLSETRVAQFPGT